MSKLRIVLVEPQIPANLGFVARCLDNFGLDDWVAVNGCKVERTEAERTGATSMAILHKLKRCDSLHEAIADCDLVIGFTARDGFRRAPLPLHLLRSHFEEQINPQLFDPSNDTRVALVFGREDRGLEGRECESCSRLVVIPTAVVFDNYAKVTVEQSFDHYSDLEWQTTPPGRKRALRNPQPVDEHPDWVQAEQAAYDNRPHLHGNVAALHAAGVTLLAGSDSPNLGLTAGGALHVELQHLVAAGLTPTEALLAATSVPAREWSRLTGRPCESGTVAEGMRADLLLVRGDPTADITATQDIAEVFLAGVRLRRIPPR